jgi:hypothetical protein
MHWFVLISAYSVKHNKYALTKMPRFCLRRNLFLVNESLTSSKAKNEPGRNYSVSELAASEMLLGGGSAY